MASQSVASQTIAEEAAGIDWYHTMELPEGVVTKGLFDHRSVAPRLPIPASLAGARCLDVASADGFWAFEMARRGAASVISLDLADPMARDQQGGARPSESPRPDLGRAERAFDIARRAFGHENVERVDRSVYDLSPETLGRFDYAFMGNVLLHLADPARALRAVGDVVATGGEMLSFEALSVPLSVLHPRRPVAQLWNRDEGRWWTPNLAAYRRLLQAGGFSIVAMGGPLRQPFGAAISRPPLRMPSRDELKFWLFSRPLGVPSWWARVRPGA